MAGRGQKAKTRNPAGFLSVLYKCAVYALTSPHRKAADGFHLPSSLPCHSLSDGRSAANEKTNHLCAFCASAVKIKHDI